ncbi:hypothetical protein DCAR_0418295 [Daucus carota subsp. sativus]|uniref:U-box domain-containing protein n=1 Tax=Daucus carota subsp. sativus TaxID=79200 RepID=A0AAF0X075_DAUCS|nr:PREDICTED: U-box domain-containing protein 30-like [Daucus carota subsp. sativus]WOG98949.1 hypothetical protein DCAR_0418295 [Daucus carota subsp. sativus]
MVPWWHGSLLHFFEGDLTFSSFFSLGISEVDYAIITLLDLAQKVKDKKHLNSVIPGLRALKKICLYGLVRSLVASIEAVPQLIEPNLKAGTLELALCILEVLSNIPKGSLAFKKCPSTIPIIVKLLMKFSELHSNSTINFMDVFELAPEEFAALAVDAGLAAKLDLVIQSGSAELLKLCSLNDTGTMFNSNFKLATAVRLMKLVKCLHAHILYALKENEPIMFTAFESI